MREDQNRFHIPAGFAAWWLDKAKNDSWIQGTRPPDPKGIPAYKVEKDKNGYLVLNFQRAVYYNYWLAVSFKATAAGIFSPYRGN